MLCISFRDLFTHRKSFKFNYKNKHCWQWCSPEKQSVTIFSCSSCFEKRLVNAGIGASGLNRFLTTQNIPWLSKQTYKSREDEARDGILRVTSKTCRDAVRKEFEAVMETESTESSG